MKKISISALVILLTVSISSCGGSSNNSENVTPDSVLLSQTREQLQQTVIMQDSLLALINEIGADMAQIKQMEAIVSVPNNLGGETNSKRDMIRGDISAISQALKERRERLNSLEKKLRKSNAQNSTLLATIETLKLQITEQENQIGSLTDQLATANAKIGALNQTVDSLNVTVTDERTGKEKALAEAQALTNELNTVYYAIGSKKELQANNIIKSGFLRKTKIMQGDYEKNYFTAVDKRTIKSIPLHSNKAKVLSNQPTDSYEITDGAGGKVLNIINPAKFWGTTNYLIIQID